MRTAEATDLLSNLSANEVKNRLRSGCLSIRVPPFVFRIRSDIPVVQEGLTRLYAGCRVLAAESTFADFHLSVTGHWSGLHRTCKFKVDGFLPFSPLAYGEAFALLEWGMNWCVTGYAHHWLTLHSAVLEKDGRAVLMPAPPGSGKSTLCAALMLHGWRLLSDEMALLDPENGLVTPFPRPVSLKNQSIDLIRRLAPEATLGPVAHDTMKGNVAHLKVSEDSLARAEVCVPAAWVVFPKYQSGAHLSVTQRPKSTSLLDLASNSFNHHIHGVSGFNALVSLVNQCQCFDLRYSRTDEALDWFDKLEPTT